MDSLNNSQKNSGQDYRDRICLIRGSNGRGSWGSGGSIFADNSFQYDQCQAGEQLLFDNLLNQRESNPKKQHPFDELDSFGDIMFQNQQKLSDLSQFDVFSRPSGRQSRGNNWAFKLPHQKNSDLLLQRFYGDSLEPQIQQKINDEYGMNGSNNFNNKNSDINHIKSRRSSNIQMSLEGGRQSNNQDGSLEIVMEWANEQVDPNELQIMISRLNLNQQQFQQINHRPDRLSLLPQKQIGCICKKTQCIKLYCQCFQNGRLCLEVCECLDCYNNENHHQDLEEAKKQIIEKNPNAFKIKTLNHNPEDLEKVDNDADEEIQPIQANKSNMPKQCNCKKSKCIKKYCECYNSGQPCTQNCNCENCENLLSHKQDLLHQQIDKQKLEELIENEVPSNSVYKKIKKT